ncbi:sensor histidine kinase [Clostridium lundense]|uniref:sensor histidine kinase n=1 Tax=Clostridium lundense TaxID=319475 RepID=UPI0004885B87|nr:HAMP domain-containing sensor histidine kinase [Clostridium lundense]
MHGIGKRILKSYIFIIFLTLFIIESILLIGIKRYYIVSVEEILSKQLEVSSNFYNKYLSDSNLNKVAANFIDNIQSNTTGEIQLIDKNKRVIIDSLHLYNGEIINSKDIDAALEGKKGRVIGKLEGTNENIMSVTMPLLSKNNVVGVLRYVTSLEKINEITFKAFIFLSGIFIVVLLILALICIKISKTITEPINNITLAAGEMAKGNYSARINKTYNDEIGKLADTLNNMAEEILKSEKLKNEFIASISHEIRTPLTSLKGWIITIKREKGIDKEELMEELDIMDKESDRLNDLIEELLDFSRLNSGKITLNIDNINLHQIIRETIKELIPRANWMKVDLIFQENKNINTIKGDKNRIKQIMINLIDNSIKFTEPQGKIYIRLEEAIKGVNIIVEDSGCGIDPKDISKIREKFYKGNNKKNGAGLGLAICDEIVKLHEGHMEIESDLGKGTKITVFLPC